MARLDVTELSPWECVLDGRKAYLRLILLPRFRNSLVAASISSSFCHANLSVTATSTNLGLPNPHPRPNHSSNFSAYFFRAAKLNAPWNSFSIEPASATLTNENPPEYSGAPIDMECSLPSLRVADFAISIASIVFDRAGPFMSSSATAQSVLYIDRRDSMSLINSEKPGGMGAWGRSTCSRLSYLR